MKPKPTTSIHSLSRRAFLAAGLVGCAGCASPLMRGQTPEEELPAVVEEPKLQMVGKFTRPWGLNWLKLESVALVTNLDNTGSDPLPSAQRQRLIGEMQSHDVRNADEILASPTTSLVIVRGYLPPGVKKGDVFDVEVRIPSRSETTSLRGGWLMQTRLRQMEALGGTIRTGSVEGLAQGNVLIDAIFDGEQNKINETRGRVPGGGVSTVARKLGLMISNEESSIRISLLIGAAINSRFFTFDAGVKKGVAEPQRDNFLELSVSPRYKHNLARYLRVVRQIALKENAIERTERLQVLEKKLLEPTTAPLAALQLEAIGKQAIDALKKGVKSSDTEVRFYAAEALAYLDESEAAAPLAEAAQKESAFRWHALTALTAMDHGSAYDALNELLHVNSVETRYGAFLALRARNPQDPVTKGESLEKKFSYHVLSSTGEPLVHITRSKRPEMVVFGSEIRLKSPQFLAAGKRISVKTLETGELKVSRFAPGKDDVHETCSMELDKLIRTVVKLGGGYTDVIQLVQEAKKAGSLDVRLAVEALPRPGRKYYRDPDDPEDVNSEPPIDEAGGDESDTAPLAQREALTPSSELFADRLRDTSQPTKAPRELTETYVDPAYRKSTQEKFLDKLTPWSSDKEQDSSGGN